MMLSVKKIKTLPMIFRKISVFEATDIIRQHRCRDPIYDMRLWKACHELDIARLRI